MTDPTPPPAPAFRLGYVPGVTPAKWVAVWHERLDVPLDLVTLDAADAARAIRAGEVDAAFVRQPLDRTDLSLIQMYVEQPVVVVAKDHVVTTADAVTCADLDDEVLLDPRDVVLTWDGPQPGRPARERPATTAGAIELAAAGIGVVVVPQSLARLHQRKDVTYRPLTDAPTSPVGLAWREGDPSDLVEEMIGIVRGRTANSSRGRRAAEEAAEASAKAVAAAKAAKAEKAARKPGPDPRAAASRKGGPRRPTTAKAAHRHRRGGR